MVSIAPAPFGSAVIPILENVGRMGTEFPEFLEKVLAELKNDLEDKKL